ncbi:hypothetical protein OIU77_030811 [Salix suchowensis]|uniref:Uncharacterized protein n=1 Tax=Salix suchowensis TaxID=1278906 RepID=A0ABQ9BDJ8_9ROSI|nr:hypothetical protein OIU77_030811 [Salix suchowensis]
MNSRRKMAKSDSIKGDNVRNCSDMGVVDVVSVERISPSSAVLAMDEHRRKISISISEVNQGDPREPDCTENSIRYASQNRMTGFAPWDGVELLPQIVESSGVENLSTGYVADEWDEEYDRGKRKKLRRSMAQLRRAKPFSKYSLRRKPKLRRLG